MLLGVGRSSLWLLFLHPVEHFAYEIRPTTDRRSRRFPWQIASPHPRPNTFLPHSEFVLPLRDGGYVEVCSRTPPRLARRLVAQARAPAHSSPNHPRRTAPWRRGSPGHAAHRALLPCATQRPTHSRTSFAAGVPRSRSTTASGRAKAKSKASASVHSTGIRCEDISRGTRATTSSSQSRCAAPCASTRSLCGTDPRRAVPGLSRAPS